MFAISVAGCSCEGEPPVDEATPRPVLAPESLGFGGFCAGGEARQEMAFKNEGAAPLSGTITFEGAAAESFHAEINGEMVTTITAPIRGETLFDVVYMPQGTPGDQEVWMVIKTNSTETPEVQALLTGFLSDNPAAPRSESNWMACHPDDIANCPNDPKEPCCWLGRTGERPPAVHLGKVGAEQEVGTQIRLENSGCADLVITEVVIGEDQGLDACAPGDVQVELPGGGLTIPGTVTTETAELMVTFFPQDRCSLNRTITLHTNDPTQPMIEFDVRGEAVVGDLIVVEPTVPPIRFGDVHKGDAKDIAVRMLNQGTEPVEVVSVEIGGDHGEHFEVVHIERCGDHVAPPFIVEPVTDPEVPDCEKYLTLMTRYEPKSGGRHGLSPAIARIVLEQASGPSSFVPLVGDSRPVFKAYPSNRIAFANPELTGCGVGHACGECINEAGQTCDDETDCILGELCLDGICTSSGNASLSNAEPQAMCATTCETAERSFLICNEEGHNDLVLSSIKIMSTNGQEGGPKDEYPLSSTFGEPKFALTPGNCMDPIAPGACCEGAIHLLDSHGGGLDNAELHIVSNASTTAGAPHVIDIVKNTQSLLSPVVAADFEVPSFPRILQPANVRAVANAPQGAITKYEWRMLTVSGASNIPSNYVVDPAEPDRDCPSNKVGGWCFQLLNDQGQACLPDGSDCTTLSFNPDVDGQYTFAVEVFGSVCSPVDSTTRNGSLDIGR